MNFFIYISDIIIPIVIIWIIIFGCTKKIDVYNTFIEGAKEGLTTVMGILPTLIGLMMAVSVLRSSGAMEFLVGIISPVTKKVGFPAEILPLSFMRLVSSSGATGLLFDLFKTFGPDSFIGRLASVMMSCTETVFYTMSVYFMSVSVKNSRYTLAGAVFANVVGIVASFYIVNLFWGM